MDIGFHGIPSYFPRVNMKNKCRIIFTVALILSTFISVAFAVEQKTNPILRGKIGKTNVMFCFAQPESGRMPGYVVGYYYVLPAGDTKYLGLDENKQYFEGDQEKKIAIWQLNEVTDQKMTGYKLVGNKKERINLSRLKARAKKPINKAEYGWENQGCDDAFNQPRVDHLLEKIKIEDKLFADKPYQVIVLKHKYTGLENQRVLLTDTFANAEQYQQKLKKQMKETLYFRLDLADGQNPSYETIKESVIYWDDNWLTLRQVSSEYSGGAHPNHWENFTTLNAQTGQEENLWSWFKNVKVETHKYTDTEYKEYHPSEAFRKLVQKFDSYTICKRIFKEDDEIDVNTCLKWKQKQPEAKSAANDDAQCNDCSDDNRLSFGLHPEGLLVRVHLDYGSGSGSYNNLIPYKNLLPYLNQKGREHVEQIMLNQSHDNAIIQN